MKKLLILGLLISQMLFLPVVAQDSSEVALSIFPAINEQVIEPGQKISGILNIANNAAEPLPVSLSVTPLDPFDTVTDKQAQQAYNAATWFEFEATNYILEPASATEVPYTITAPNDASAGGHYANVTVRALRLASERPSQNTATILPEISATFLLTTPGDILESAELDVSQIIKSRIDAGTEQSLEFSVKNTGNVHMLLSPTLTISKGDEVLSSPSMQPQIVLPNTSKTFRVPWTADSGYGAHSINVDVTFGTPQQSISSEQISFTVTPSLLQVTLVGLFGVIVLAAILRWRQLPRIADILRGRASSIGSFKQSGGMEVLGEEPDPQSYQEVIKELERQRPILGLPEDEPIIFSDETVEKAKKSEDNNQKSARLKAKTQDLVETSLESEASISEELHPETKSKTVIIQTGSSTIVREEPILSPPTAIEEKNVVNAAPTKKTIKIKVTHHEETDKKTKSKSKSKKKTKTKPKAANKKTK